MFGVQNIGPTSSGYGVCNIMDEIAKTRGSGSGTAAGRKAFCLFISMRDPAESLRSEGDA